MKFKNCRWHLHELICIPTTGSGDGAVREGEEGRGRGGEARRRGRLHRRLSPSRREIYLEPILTSCSPSYDKKFMDQVAGIDLTQMSIFRVRLKYRPLLLNGTAQNLA